MNVEEMMKSLRDIEEKNQNDFIKKIIRDLEWLNEKSNNLYYRATTLELIPAGASAST